VEPLLCVSEPGSRLKSPCSCELTLEPVLEPEVAGLAWPGWPPQASSAIARKPAAAAVAAVRFAPTARRRAAWVREVGGVTPLREAVAPERRLKRP
jgi:hypothetical protein